VIVRQTMAADNFAVDFFPRCLQTSIYCLMFRANTTADVCYTSRLCEEERVI
jgi:hypothetical protein